MAFPGSLSSTEISDIIATTAHSRSGVLADNVTNHTPMLFRMKQKGKIKPFSGGDVILQELSYHDSTTMTAQYYSGYETINIQANSPISAARFDIKQAAASVTISGLEMLQNSGKEAIIDLIDARMEIAEAQLTNLISAGLYSDGTGTGSKQITGLQAAIADDPTTSTTYGSINQATYSWWQNYVYDASDHSITPSSTTIQSLMNTAAVNLVRNNEGPDLIVADPTWYAFYLASMQTIQRVMDEKMAGAGFTSLKYFGAGQSSDVVLGGSVAFDGSSPAGGMPTARMYFLNTNYLFWRPHRDRNFVPIGGERQSVNQDAVVKLIGVAGNLTCSNRKLQGLIKA